MHRSLLALAALLCTASACAHDSWFEPRPGHRLALATGNAFPVMETGIGAQYIARSGCDRGELAVAEEGEQALLFDLPPAATDCWVQLTPFDVTLEPDKIDLYLREVRPPAAIVDAWREMQARGLPWRERYTKHARIAIGGAATEPAPLGMDMLLEAPGRFRVLRDGQPLPRFNVELRHEKARFGIWRQTDAEGRLAFMPPLPGRWVLRGVDLRLSTTQPGRFESRFVTLAFEVQNGMNLRFNALSASQAPATAAISSEPATSTPRR